jgi:hypothetical protein
LRIGLLLAAGIIPGLEWETVNSAETEMRKWVVLGCLFHGSYLEVSEPNKR